MTKLNILLFALTTICYLPFSYSQADWHGHVHVSSQGDPKIAVHNLDLDLDHAHLGGQTAEWIIAHEEGPYFIDARIPIPFHHVRLEGKKTEVILGQYVTLGEALTFAGGRIDLVDHIISMEPDAILENETERSYLTASGEGFVSIAAYLPANMTQSPGQLGVEIVCEAEPGKGEIRRGHQAQALPTGAGASRWYAFNDFNAEVAVTSLIFRYRDGELNGLTEEELVVWHSLDHGQSWTQLRPRQRNTRQNTIQVADVPLTGRYTLGKLQETAVGDHSPSMETTKSTPNLHSLQWRAYPNPMVDQVTIEAGSVIAQAGFQLYNATGQPLPNWSKADTQTANESAVVSRQAIDVSHLPAGIYWLHTAAEGVPPLRLVKQ